MVLEPRLGDRTGAVLAGLAKQFAFEILPFGEDHARAAVEAWGRFGRGNHPARLNFGDCISYATSFVASEPLLFVGDDFAQTDVVPA